MSCHTIGGGQLVGPDLGDVTKRRDPAWVADFIYNPKKCLASSVPYVLKLKEDARGAIVPQIAGMTPDKALQLVKLIDAESAAKVSQFVGLSIGDQPFTAADIQAGYEIFAGIRPTTNGSSACINCHATARLPFLVAYLENAATKGGQEMNRKVLVRVAGAILVGEWLDLFIAIFPTKSPVVPPAGLWELAAFTAAAITIVVLVQHSLTRRPLLAEEHPLFEESRTYHGQAGRRCCLIPACRGAQRAPKTLRARAPARNGTKAMIAGLD